MALDKALDTLGRSCRRTAVPGHPRAPRPLRDGGDGAPRVRQPGQPRGGRAARPSTCSTTRTGAARRAHRRAEPVRRAPTWWPGCGRGPATSARPGRLGRRRTTGWPTAPRSRATDRTLAVVATPGHTQGHVVFVDAAAGLLFAGDHVLPHITPSIGFEPVPVELAAGRLPHSLRLVRELPDRRLLPAHGAGPAERAPPGGRAARPPRAPARQAPGRSATGTVTAYEVARGSPGPGASARLRRSRPVQPDAGGHRDRGASRPAGGPGPVAGRDRRRGTPLPNRVRDTRAGGLVAFGQAGSGAGVNIAPWLLRTTRCCSRRSRPPNRPSM